MPISAEDQAFLSNISGGQAPNQDAIFLQQLMHSQMPEDVPQYSPKEAHGMWDSFAAGLESSTGGLIARQELPDITVGPDADRADRISRMVGQVLGDLPTLIGGGLLGAGGGPIGAAAGSFGLTEGTRTWLMEQYSKGFTKRDLADRLTATAWAATKGAITGAGTAGVAGKVAGMAAVEAMTPISQTLARSGAELATMVTVSKGLEGKLPDAQDFIDGAIFLGGLKLAHQITPKLRTIYQRTGKTPKEVVEEAQKDPKVHMDVIDREYDAIPESMRGAERSPFAPMEPIESKAVGASGEKLSPPANINTRGTEHLNYNVTFRDVPEMHSALAAIAESVRPEIDAARKAGGVPWEMQRAAVEHEATAWLGKQAAPGAKQFEGMDLTQLTTEIRARTLMVKGLMQDWMEKAALVRKSPEDAAAQAQLLGATERLQSAYVSARGGTSEIGRALNALKDSESLAAAERLVKLKDVVDKNGGAEAAKQMADFAEELTDPAKAAQILGSKATTMDKVLEFWKAGLVSGLRTQEVNLISNMTFSLTRVPKELIADTIGRLKGQEKSVTTNTIMLTRGLARGALDAFKMAKIAIDKNVEEKGFLAGVAKTILDQKAGAKTDSGITPKIGGLTGQIIRTPFKLLSAGDTFFRTMNERADLYASASRIAQQENLKPFSPEFEARVVDLVREPTNSMKAAAKLAGDRYVFTEKVEGGLTETLENVVARHKWLEFILPFKRTPGAIFREFTRMSPFAPLLKRWREDFHSTDPAISNRAKAEALMGTGMAIGVWVMAHDGAISGAGHPDKAVRNAWRAAGWQPYSIQLSNGKWISYSRLDPIGTLIGMVANVSTAWDLMNTAERDKAWSVLSFAFVEVVNNKTWLKGLSTVMAAMADPAHYGPSWAESLAGSFVPFSGLVGQTAQDLDPYLREVNGVLDAVQSRIPGAREDLMPRRDIFGEPIKVNPGLWPTAPYPVSTESTDKVRQEARRLNVGQGGAPTGINLNFPGRPAERRIEFTPEQKDIFSSEAGKTAHELLSKIVNSPGWDQQPAMLQRQYYIRAFTAARRRASIMALPPEQRVNAINALREEYGL